MGRRGGSGGLVLAVVVAAACALFPSVAVAQSPTFTDAFGAPHIPVGGTTTLTFTITNPDAPTALANVSFDDNALPGGLTLTQAPTTTCTGGMPSSSGPSDIAFTDASLTDSSCTVTATVAGSSPGTQTNPAVTLNFTGGTASTMPASINVDEPPTITESFSPTTISAGATSQLTLTLTNPSPNPDSASDVSFTDPLPAGLTISGTPTNSCGGTLTNGLSLSGGTIAAGDQCQISATVTASGAGQYPNPTGNVSSTEGGTGTNATATLTVVDAPPTISEAFTPTDIHTGGTTQLTFTITNPNPADAATGVSFADPLPGGLSVPPGQAPNCAGTPVTTSSNGISLSRATIAPGQRCQFTVTVTGAASGRYTNPTGPVSSDNGGQGAGATANPPLTVASPPAITEAFGTSLLGLDGTTSLTFTITNPNPTVPLTGIGFSDTLPASLHLASVNGAGNTCGGVLTATSGSGSVILGGGQVPAGASCTISESVTATGRGIVTNPTSAVTSSEGGAGNSTSATLTVIGAPRVTLTSPVGGVTYAFGQKVHAHYSCVDDPNGPGISSCRGNVPNGSLINTSKAGSQAFTVTAISKDGGIGSDTTFYKVAPNNHVKLGRIHVHRDGSVNFTVGVPGPGKLQVLETAPDRGAAADASARRPGPGHFAFGSAHLVVSRARTVRLTVKPDARGRKAMRTRSQLRVIVWVTYTPRGGKARTISAQWGFASGRLVG